VTDLMNTYAFEVARLMSMPNTNHTRYVEVFLDGDYIGIYQLTEKIEVNSKRVDIDEQDGVMLSLDQDDGPNLSPDATDNFWSAVYNMPMCVKYPDEPTSGKVDSIRADFALLEKAIKTSDYDSVKALLDVSSFISLLQLHEYLYNVEIDAPRSIYLYKDKGGKYVMGPVWDWDAGYDFNWGNMYTGHTFFSDYTELIYGTNPIKQNGEYKINKFFIDLFKIREFVVDYKKKWADISDSLYIKTWEETLKYAEELKKGAYDREAGRWPITEINEGWWGNSTITVFKAEEEINKMGEWLQNRKAYLDEVISGYPLPSENSNVKKDTIVVGTIKIDVKCSYNMGYSQSGNISVNIEEFEKSMGDYNEDNLSLVPINNDGSEGDNTAAGTYGAWFGENGNTAPWANGHVYIESNDLFVWNYGCHPDNCSRGDEHTARMRYLNSTSENVNVVDVFVNFIIY
nr:CotH kinase family protein [Bacteroidaceae bacterium]